MKYSRRFKEKARNQSSGEREKTTYNAWGMRGIGGGFGGVSPQQNVESTVIVSLYDAKQKELIWGGIA